uniref:Uncharacterized protein n=1 Tax=Colletotrichum fructicola (strain Nara gc5) TaxID=1213859 RepID=L2GE40_COLFN
MADEDGLLDKVHGLSDLELAALLCLVNREHCIVSTPPAALDELVEELQLIATKTFGLKCAVVDCTPQTSLEDFASSILTQQSLAAPRSGSPLRTRNDSYFSRAGISPLTSVTATSPTGQGIGGSSIAHVIVARNLDRAPRAVQIQTAPKQFLFIAALGAESGGQAHVTLHLNDYLFIAHWHDPDDGFPNLDDAYDAADGAETASTESVLKKSINGDLPAVSENPLFREGDVAAIAKSSRDVQIDVDVLRYLMNWGSQLEAIESILEGVGPEDVIEDVLGMVTAPL